MAVSEYQFINWIDKGDETSFKTIYNHFYPRLFYFISEYIPQKDIVEDILHDTFLTLCNKRKELEPNSNLNAWLYTVAKNNSLKKLRDQKSRNLIFQSIQISEFELELNMGALAVLDTSEMSFAEVQKIIQSTLNALSPQCKLVFEMSRFSNKKNKEIAEELGISIKTVEGHITKAIKSFKIELKDFLPLVAFLFFS